MRGRAVRELVDRVATVRAILIGGWLWFLVYAYPGYMSYDSVWQLIQARHIEPINEWNPPLMAFIWHFTDAVIAGPMPMLVLQSLAFLLGLYALLGHVMTKRAAAIAAVIVLIVPQNIVVMGVIWKDAQMAGFLVASIAALLSDKRGWRIAGYLFVFLATGVRYNAAAATLPIVLVLFRAPATMRWWRRYAIAVAAWIAITGAALLADYMLVERNVYPWQTASAPVDIAGTIRFSPHLDNAQLLQDTEGVPWVHFDKIQIRARTWYRPDAHFLTITQGPGALFEYPTTDAQRDAIAAAWRKLVLAHPWPFVRHRLAVFWAQLHADASGGVWSGFTNAEWGEDILHHRASHSWVQETWIHAVELFEGTVVYRVWIYFVIALAFLPMCRQQRLAFVVLTSGILYELGLFAVAPAVDYRYSHWMVVCTIIGGIVLFAARRKRDA